MSNPRMRFQVGHLVNNLTPVYRERYRGSESNILFDPMQFVTFDIVIEVPHLLMNDERMKKEIERLGSRLVGEFTHRCEQFASELLTEMKQTEKPPAST